MTAPASGASESPVPDARASLLGTEARVVNIGLSLFADTLAALGLPVIHVDWRPPAGGDPRLAALLARLSDERGGG